MIINNNDDIKMLKIRILLSESENEPLIEKLILTDENGVQYEVNMKYETVSKEEIFEAMNIKVYTAALM